MRAKSPRGRRKCRKCGISKRHPDEFAPTRNGTVSQTCILCQVGWLRSCERCGEQRRVPNEIGPRGRRCVQCKREVKRLGHQRYYRANRERIIARVQAWNAAHPERHREHLAKSWDRMRSDPERYTRYLVNKRIDKRLTGYVLNAQHKIKNAYEPWIPLTEGCAQGEQLDAAPLVAWLRQEFPDWTNVDLADYIGHGIDESHLSKLMTGLQKEISISTADRIFVGTGCTHMLALLYPIEEAA